jgi:hypothetical protein
LQVPPKFTRIGIFGTKICHLATLDVVTAAAKFFSKKVVLQKKFLQPMAVWQTGG